MAKAIKRVLVADDSKFMRLVVRNMLTGLGCEVVAEAENIQQCVQKYKELRPDLVTMDLIMVGGNGLQGVEELRKLDPQAAILVISSMGQQSMVNEALRLGAKGFISKPVKEEQFSQALQKLRGE